MVDAKFSALTPNNFPFYSGSIRSRISRIDTHTHTAPKHIKTAEKKHETAQLRCTSGIISTFLMKTFGIIVTFFIRQLFITFVPVEFSMNLSFHLIRMDYVFFVLLYDSFCITYCSPFGSIRNIYTKRRFLWCVGGSFVGNALSILCVLCIWAYCMRFSRGSEME